MGALSTCLADTPMLLSTIPGDVEAIAVEAMAPEALTAQPTDVVGSAATHLDRAHATDIRLTDTKQSWLAFVFTKTGLPRATERCACIDSAAVTGVRDADPACLRGRTTGTLG